MDNKIANFLFESTGVSKLGKYLDLSAFRHKLIGGNVANVSTPGYRSRDVDFHAEFKRMSGDGSSLSAATTHRNHIPTGNHPAGSPRVNSNRVLDGEMNSVDIDKEISNLTQNELRFTVGATLLQRKFDALRKAINGR